MSTLRKTLRNGWTTGACAAAAAGCAARALFRGEFPDAATVRLPGGETPVFALSRTELGRSQAVAGIVKDAGDDPDVTHGAEIVATVAAGAPGSGIAFRAGEGVGTVTLPGLPVDVGEPAINPGPRMMIAEALEDAARECCGHTDLIVTVSIPGGDRLAEKTMNGRLGIKGGLSILGTTGIVRPFSCSAWIHAIHSGIDVARAGGIGHIAACTGRTSEKAVRELYGLPEQALIDMGDFAGGLFKYLRRHPVARLTIGGGLAKLAKLAGGHMDLHSSRSVVDFKALADDLAELGAGPGTVAAAATAATATAVLDLARAAGLPLADRIAGKALTAARAALEGGAEPGIAVEVLVVARDGRIAGRAGGFGDDGGVPDG